MNIKNKTRKVFVIEKYLRKILGEIDFIPRKQDRIIFGNIIEGVENEYVVNNIVLNKLLNGNEVVFVLVENNEPYYADILSDVFALEGRE